MTEAPAPVPIEVPPRKPCSKCRQHPRTKSACWCRTCLSKNYRASQRRKREHYKRLLLNRMVREHKAECPVCRDEFPGIRAELALLKDTVATLGAEVKRLETAGLRHALGVRPVPPPPGADDEVVAVAPPDAGPHRDPGHKMWLRQMKQVTRG